MENQLTELLHPMHVIDTSLSQNKHILIKSHLLRDLSLSGVGNTIYAIISKCFH